MFRRMGFVLSRFLYEELALEGPAWAMISLGITALIGAAGWAAGHQGVTWIQTQFAYLTSVH